MVGLTFLGCVVCKRVFGVWAVVSEVVSRIT